MHGTDVSIAFLERALQFTYKLLRMACETLNTSIEDNQSMLLLAVNEGSRLSNS